jgi:hypothetical protein
VKNRADGDIFTLRANSCDVLVARIVDVLTKQASWPSAVNTSALSTHVSLFAGNASLSDIRAQNNGM